MNLIYIGKKKNFKLYVSINLNLMMSTNSTILWSNYITTIESLIEKKKIINMIYSFNMYVIYYGKYLLNLS